MYKTRKRGGGNQAIIEYGGENYNMPISMNSSYSPQKFTRNYSNVQQRNFSLPNKKTAKVGSYQHMAQAFPSAEHHIGPNQARRKTHFLARNTGTRILFRKSRR